MVHLYIKLQLISLRLVAAWSNSSKTLHSLLYGQSYKRSTIAIDISRVVNITSKHNSRVVIYTCRGFIRLATGADHHEG